MHLQNYEYEDFWITLATWYIIFGGRFMNPLHKFLMLMAICNCDGLCMPTLSAKWLTLQGLNHTNTILLCYCNTFECVLFLLCWSGTSDMTLHMIVTWHTGNYALSISCMFFCVIAHISGNRLCMLTVCALYSTEIWTMCLRLTMESLIFSFVICRLRLCLVTCS
jgi:hypothetical protein